MERHEIPRKPVPTEITDAIKAANRAVAETLGTKKQEAAQAALAAAQKRYQDYLDEVGVEIIDVPDSIQSEGRAAVAHFHAAEVERVQRGTKPAPKTAAAPKEE